MAVRRRGRDSSLTRFTLRRPNSSRAATNDPGLSETAKTTLVFGVVGVAASPLARTQKRVKLNLLSSMPSCRILRP